MGVEADGACRALHPQGADNQRRRPRKPVHGDVYAPGAERLGEVLGVASYIRPVVSDVRYREKNREFLDDLRAVDAAVLPRRLDGVGPAEHDRGQQQ